jgi:hypothetical protein
MCLGAFLAFFSFAYLLSLSTQPCSSRKIPNNLREVFG